MPDTTQSAQRRRLLSIDEVAYELCLSPKTIRAWCQRREIPFVRINTHNIRIRPETLDELINRGEVRAAGRRRANPRAVHAAD